MFYCLRVDILLISAVFKVKKTTVESDILRRRGGKVKMIFKGGQSCKNKMEEKKRRNKQDRLTFSR